MHKKLPQHVAIIMDGNGRWAVEQGLSRTQGHKQGLQAARQIIDYCCQKKINALSLFAFGIDNNQRTSKEVRNLFRLFFLALRYDLDKLHQRNIRLRIIGQREFLAPFLLRTIEYAENLTVQNQGLQLQIAINYSGRWDITQAIQQLLRTTTSATATTIDEKLLAEHLAFKDLQDPDLLIRTGGVQRISNFMLWQLAYTELFFTQTLWPNFTLIEFEAALSDYAQRERRFGLTSEQLKDANV